MKALVVEDLKIMRKVIVNALKEIDIKDSFEAEDGIEALSLLQEEKIDLIVTDWLMPNMDGFELVTDIKKDKRLKNIPILMITSVDDRINVVKAIKAGINDYIAKPFKPETLKEKIKNIIYSV